MLKGRGELMFRDFTFPVFDNSFRDYHLPVWNVMIDKVNLDSLYRAFSRFPLIILSYLLPVSIVLKIYIFGIFLIGQLSFCYFAKTVLKIQNKTLLFLLGFLFVYNSRFLDFLQGISLALVYALIPLLITLIHQSLQHNKFFNKYLFWASIVTLLMFVHPYALAFTAIFVVFWVFLIEKQKTFWYKAKQLITLGFVHICLSAYFVAPFAASWIKSGPINPETGGYYKFTYAIVDYLSSSTVLEKLSLTRSVVTYFDVYPQDSWLQGFWFINSLALTLLLPILLLVFRKKITKISNLRLWPVVPFYFGLLLLSFGTSGPISAIYYKLLDTVPTSLNWLLKSPPKLQLFTFGVLVIILAIVLNYLFQRLGNNFKRRIFGVLLLGSMVFYCFYNYVGFFLEDRFTPVIVPIEYQKVNKIMNLMGTNSKVIYYPLYNEKPTTWSGDRPIEPFDIVSSQTPTENYWWNGKASNDYFFQNLYKKNRVSNICDYLAPFNIQYLVFHNDLTPPYDYLPKQVLNQLLKFYPDKLIYKNSDWYLFDLECQNNYKFQIRPNLSLETSYQQSAAIFNDFNLIDYQSKASSYSTFDSQIKKISTLIPLDQIKVDPADTEKSTDWFKANSHLKLDDQSQVSNIFVPKAGLEVPGTSTKVNFDSKNNTLVETVDDNFQAADFNDNVAGLKLLQIISKPLPISDINTYHINMSFDTQDIKRFSGTYSGLNALGQVIDDLEIPLKFDRDGTKLSLSQDIFVPKGATQITFNLRTLQTSKIQKLSIENSNLSVLSNIPNLNLSIKTPDSNQNYSVFADILLSPLGRSVNTNTTTETLAKSRFETVYLGQIPPNQDSLSLRLSGFNALQNIRLAKTSDFASLPPFVNLNSNCPTIQVQSNSTQSIHLKDDLHLCYSNETDLLSPQIQDLLQYFLQNKTQNSPIMTPTASPIVYNLKSISTNWLPASNNYSLSTPWMFNDFLKANNEPVIKVNSLLAAIPINQSNKISNNDQVFFSNQLDEYFKYGIIFGLLVLAGYFWLCFR